MIRANEIIKLLEVVPKTISTFDIESFMDLLRSKSFGADLKLVKNGLRYIVYSDYKLIKDTSSSPDPIIDLMKGYATKRFQKSASSLKTQLGRYKIYAASKDFSELPYILFDDSDVYLRLGMVGPNSSSVGSRAQLPSLGAGSIRMELEFSIALFNISTDFLERVIYKLANVFSSFDSEVSQSRKQHVSSIGLDTVIDGLVRNLRKITGLNILITKLTAVTPFIILSCKFELEKSTGDKLNSPAKNYFSECHNDFVFSFVKIRDFCSGLKESLTPLEQQTTTSFSSGGVKTNIKVRVDIPEGNIVTVECVVNPLPELALLSSDKLDELTNAIAYAFSYHNKLINRFNNKPTKKTNADW